MRAAAERAPWMNPRILTTLMLVFLAGAATGAVAEDALFSIGSGFRSERGV